MKYSILITLVLLFTTVNARFNREHNNTDLDKLLHYKTGDGDVNGFFGDMQGLIIDSLLAAAPPCSVQIQCDKIMDMKRDLTKLAQSLIQSEKNTPDKGQRSVICTKKPRHHELDGLCAKQDPEHGRGNKLPPFVPEKFSTIRVFDLKLKGKRITPNLKEFPDKHQKAKKCKTK
ncbi:920_t:CDS:2 [Scutellospora calospora]|uniref:920_t:CDS:1 n=1 Tax=Scutellospora calospora TaxID=85575 RepID=A0ACA9LMC5_9GLOM|nr:920_t:CDS:2 [Scutellospora calospora]